MAIDLNTLPDGELKTLLANLESLDVIRAADPIAAFTPYPKQAEFLAMGATKRERLFLAGNRVGKSETGCLEVSAHLTGRYPSWWRGRRFTHPTVCWACGASGQAVRDVLQPKLFGYPTDERPTGFIPKDLIVGNPVPSHGVGGSFDLVRVKHISGGTSTLLLKSYEQAVEKWMGAEIDVALLDEEAPQAHYDEALARLKPGGVMMTTFTPLLGLTDLLCRFLRETDPKALADRGVVRMSLMEALHFTEQDREQRIAGYAPHMRDARTYGTPALGSGAVFTTPVSQISVDSELDIPSHWPKIWSIDFGIFHPFAACLCAWDRDMDVFYVLHTIRMENARPAEHVAAMKRVAPQVVVAWPHDGSSREKSTGDTLISAYRQYGMQFLHTHATWPTGGISTEAGIMEMDERFTDGRLRIKSHCADIFDEYRSYHRDTGGNLVKVRDDLLSALRIALMMKRYARVGSLHGKRSSDRSPRISQGFV